MATREIPPEEWSEFLKRFSHERRWRMVDLEILDPDAGVGMEVEGLPLEEVVAEARHGSGSLEILVGTPPDVHLGHRILAPVRLHLLEAEADREEILEVQAESGERTLIHFRRERFPAET